MKKSFKRGDHVEWNSEAGRVRGIITKKVTFDVTFKGYVHHASNSDFGEFWPIHFVMKQDLINETHLK